MPAAVAQVAVVKAAAPGKRGAGATAQGFEETLQCAEARGRAAEEEPKAAAVEATAVEEPVGVVEGEECAETELEGAAKGAETKKVRGGKRRKAEGEEQVPAVNEGEAGETPVVAVAGGVEALAPEAVVEPAEVEAKPVEEEAVEEPVICLELGGAAVPVAREQNAEVVETEGVRAATVASAAAVETVSAEEEVGAGRVEVVLKKVKENEEKAAAEPVGLMAGPAPREAAAADRGRGTAPAAPIPVAEDAQFAETNHASIVTAVKTQLRGEGGTMQIRLDPPELGALQVKIEMRDGAVTASFQTSNEQATHLLSHSLARLKDALETQGVSVQKLQVEQAPPEQFNGGGDTSQGQPQEQAFEQEQQRREMLRRMWRRVSDGGDPLDLMA